MMFEKNKSKTPKKAATTRLTPITTPVYLMVCSLLNQLTFFNSSRASLTKVIIFFIIKIVFKNSLSAF